jgi:CysZ protein
MTRLTERMNLLAGIRYNLRGLLFGLKTPALLLWGLTRLVAVVLITVICASLILVFHKEIMDIIWARPESRWILWLWYALSWLLSLFLVGLSTVFSYLISQILFSVIIMDHMSRITELKITGQVKEPKKLPLLRLFSYLIKQEIPRATLPVLLSLLLMFLGILIPLGAILVFFTSGMAIIFVSWDNTDLVPARRFVSFGDRFHLLIRTIPFHLGFGLLFLIPGLNILFLSFAPIGATMYFLDKHDSFEGKRGS